MDGLNFAILSTLGGVGKRYKKPYCYPSQKTILELLKKYHQMVISKRTLNRRLRLLEDAGFFERVRRHFRDRVEDVMILKSTLYKFKRKLFNLMGSLIKQTKSFFSVFRVPFLAHNHSKGEEASTSEARLPVDNPVDKPQNGRKPAKILNGILGWR